MRPRPIEQCARCKRAEEHRRVENAHVLRSGRGSVRSALLLSGLLPGFRAYRVGGEGIQKGRALPGFKARSYRDLGHTRVFSSYEALTGISGTALPGLRPQSYRETGHGAPGTWGTNEPATTGIPGTDRPPNPAKGLRFLGRNSVFSNLCKNSPTQGCSFFRRGRGL
jgi:hypothetical protein